VHHRAYSLVFTPGSMLLSKELIGGPVHFIDHAKQSRADFSAHFRL
jgi:hypothetical protein